MIVDEGTTEQASDDGASSHDDASQGAGEDTGDSGTTEEPVDDGEVYVEGAEPGTEEEITEPKYEPNYSYRFNGEEYEMDERLRGYIKSEDDESYFRELVERAEGLPFLKDQRDQLRQQTQMLNNTEMQRQQAVSQLQEFAKAGELEPILKTFGISKEQVHRYVSNQMRIEEMDPAERQEWEQNSQARAQNMSLEFQNQQYQQQLRDMQLAALDNQVNTTLNSPQISEKAQLFDERMGRQGAFRDEVVNRGVLYNNQGKHASPEQLANEVIQLSGLAYAQPAQGGGQNQAPTQGDQKVVVMEQKPTLPNIKSTGQSPIKKTYKSINELRQRAQEIQATGR